MGADVEDIRVGGSRPRKSGNFYKVVVQATLMFGTETWVMYLRIGRNLGGFHHRMYCRLKKIQMRRYMMGRWVYTHLEKAMI